METNQIEKIWQEWKIEELLGEGASGKVYKAKRKDIEDTYSAIKIIEIPQNESEIREAESEGMGEKEVKEYFKGFVDDLVEEITLLENLKEAKGIVGISDYKVVEKEGTIGWTIYIRMELLTGINKYISQNPITEEDIINIGLDLSEALEYCEKLKIIHRDIKPENIFISRFGEYKLGDFGIARRLENTSSIMSKKGTYLYMPPEVYKGEEYDKTVDLYSLGLVMYKLGNENRNPFLPKAPNPITYRDKEKALMMRMQGEKIPKPENMSEELYKIIEKMIAYNPKERYQSAKQVKDDLEKIKEKNAKEYTGTVNIFTHKSTPKIENTSKKEIKNIEKEEIVKVEEIEQEDGKEKVGKTEPVQNSRKESMTNKKSDETKIGEKKKYRKILLLIIAIVIIIVVLGIKILGQKEETEIVSEQIIMPNLLNLTKEEAEKLLEGKELEITYQDTYQEGAEKGKIVYQSIAADDKVEKGSKIIVFINNLEKEQVEKVVMINVIGENLEEAKATIENMGLRVEFTEQNDTNVEKGKVISQSPNEGEEIEKGSIVNLIVSLGKEEKQEQKDKTTNNQQTTNKPTTTETNQHQEQPVQQPAPSQTTTPSNQQTTQQTQETIRLSITGSPGMRVGKSTTFKAKVRSDTTSNYQIVWSSSNTSIATVSSTGLVTAKSAGNVKITATIKGTNITRDYPLLVSTGKIKCDANGDGIVTNEDAQLVLNAYAAGASSEMLELCDMDGNGYLNSNDAAMIQDKISYGY